MNPSAVPVRDAVFGPRIDVRPAFRRDRAELLDLLRELGPADWTAPTAAAPWTVRDLVAHLLADDVNRLGRTRDGHAVGPGPGEELASFLHRINDEWVRATVRTSPRVLLTLLEATTAEVLALWAEVDLDAVGEPVSWAGPAPAPVWLDCARDHTEYWVHHRQIREAVGRGGPVAPDVLGTVLDVLLRAVPATLAEHGPARPGEESLSVVAAGASPGLWTWRRGRLGWAPAGPSAVADTVVAVDGDALWRLCVRMMQPAAIRAAVTGDPAVADAVLQVVSIIR